MMPPRILVLVLVSVTLSAVAQITMKAGMSRPSMQSALAGGDQLATALAAVANPFLVAGFGLYFVGALVWLLVLARVDVSMAYPFVSLGFLMTAGLAALLLGESISAKRLLGILLVAIGVYTVART
jgi:drug/metabolite transporter (DMT)-like permease